LYGYSDAAPCGDDDDEADDADICDGYDDIDGNICHDSIYGDGLCAYGIYTCMMIIMMIL